jgi:hypothetical protein
MLYWCVLWFLVASLLDTFAAAITFLAILALYDWRALFSVSAIVQIVIATAVAALHRWRNVRATWQVWPSNDSTTTSLPTRHRFEYSSEALLHYAMKSTHHTVAATTVAVLVTALYRRQLENAFPLGSLVSTALACGVLLLLDIYAYYERETKRQHDSVFHKADAAVASLSTTTSKSQTPPPALVLLERADMYGTHTAYVAVMLCAFDLVLYRLSWTQTLIGIAVLTCWTLVGSVIKHL